MERAVMCHGFRGIKSQIDLEYFLVGLESSYTIKWLDENYSQDENNTTKAITIILPTMT